MSTIDAPAELDQLRAALLALTPAQETAAEALAAGATHAAAAEAANVARETVTRWSGHHPAFRAAFDLYRAAQAAEQAAACRRIRAKALDAVEAGLEAGTLDPLAVLRAVPAPPADTAPASLTAGQLLDADTNRTRGNLPPLPITLADPLDLTRPDDAERAATVTVERLALAAGLTEETAR